MRKALFFAALAAALAFIIAAGSICPLAHAQGSAGEVPTPGAGAERVVLAYVSTTHAVLAGVAFEEGYYRQEELEDTARRHSFGRSDVALDQFLVLALEDESRWAMSSGRVTRRKVPNYLDFVHFDGLGSVKPDGVRILR